MFQDTKERGSWSQTMKDKNKLLIFLPVMKEMEELGLNPVNVMFGNEHLSIEIIEKSYIALSRAKKKYPIWYNVVGSYIGKFLG